MKMTKLSVIMSCYNEPTYYLKEAIESILEQSFKNFEFLIALDNPQNFNLVEFLDSYKTKDKRIKFLVNERRLGPGASRNRLVKMANSKYIAVMDADDISDKYRLEKQLDILERNIADVVGSWIIEFADNEDRKFKSVRKVPQFHDEIIAFAKRRSPINNVSAFFRKDIFNKVGGYDEKLFYGEDYVLFVKMILYGAKFYNIQEPLVKVRMDSNFINRRIGLKYCLQDIILFKKIYKLGFINKQELLSNIIMRCPVRLMPPSIAKVIYELIRKL